mmetsp:Transcript_5118/g.15135  ORF Transcript_5118/g.15135 Transcript_5118/m.15135 type:complete len:208 (+) Transcript_5118:3-626(+)
MIALRIVGRAARSSLDSAPWPGLLLVKPEVLQDSVRVWESLNDATAELFDCLGVASGDKVLEHLEPGLVADDFAEERRDDEHLDDGPLLVRGAEVEHALQDVAPEAVGRQLREHRQQPMKYPPPLLRLPVFEQALDDEVAKLVPGQVWGVALDIPVQASEPRRRTLLEEPLEHTRAVAMPRHLRAAALEVLDEETNRGGGRHLDELQ